MKKILLITMIPAFFLQGFSQHRAIAPKHLREQSVPWKAPVTESLYAATNCVSVQAPYKSDPLVEEEHVGSTWYDLQTNSTMQNRIYKFDDGTIGATYILGYDYEGSYPDRGTGYNYFDGSAWGPIVDERIEPDRTGWPAYAPLGDNGEIVVAHYAGDAAEGLIFSWREDKGSGDWEFFDLIGPEGSPGLAWPRLVTSGTDHSVMHLITLTLPVANGGSIYQGMDGALLYSRSTDGGNYWEPENELPDEINSNYYTHFAGDSYEIDARDDIVAFVAGDSWTDLLLMKSTDSGESWDKTIIWENPYPFFDPSNPIVTDTFYCPDGSHDIVIDLTGKVHVVFGINRAICADGVNLSWFPLVDGLGYWMEGRETFSNGLHSLDPYGHPESELIEDYSLIGWAQDINVNGVWDILGEIGLYYVGVSSMPTMVVDDMNYVYVVFSSVTETFNNGLQDYRHLWGRASSNGGTWWGGFIDLTSDLIHIYDECVFPSMSPTSDENVYLTYQFDNEPGMSVKGDLDDPGLNKIQYMVVGKPEFPTGIKEYPMPVTNRDVSEVIPNPVCGPAEIRVHIRKPVHLSMEIVNPAGNVITAYNAGEVRPGMSVLTFDSRDLTAGVFFCRVKAGETTVSRKLIVQ